MPYKFLLFLLASLFLSLPEYPRTLHEFLQGNVKLVSIVLALQLEDQSLHHQRKWSCHRKDHEIRKVLGLVVKYHKDGRSTSQKFPRKDQGSWEPTLVLENQMGLECHVQLYKLLEI